MSTRWWCAIPSRARWRNSRAPPNIPVINGGDGPGEHPSQALLDLYTIQREFSRLGKLAWTARTSRMVGDLKYGRTVHSLIKLLALFANSSSRWCRRTALRDAGVPRRAGRAQRPRDRADRRRWPKACAGADVVYATRMQKERFAERSRAEGYTPDFQINQALIDAYCSPNTLDDAPAAARRPRPAPTT